MIKRTDNFDELNLTTRIERIVALFNIRTGQLVKVLPESRRKVVQALWYLEKRHKVRRIGWQFWGAALLLAMTCPAALLTPRATTAAMASTYYWQALGSKDLKAWTVLTYVPAIANHSPTAALQVCSTNDPALVPMSNYQPISKCWFVKLKRTS